jgi:hypothetical protein
MIRKRNNSLRCQTWHPSEDELLLYSDGEIDAKSSARIEAHLKSCWSCRVKREETDRLISAFMKSRRSTLGTSLNPPSGALLRLQTTLDRLDSELGVRPFFSQAMVVLKQWFDVLRRTRRWPLLSLRWAPLLATSASLLFILFKMSSAPPVSAREILERTQRAEAQRIQKIAAPVVYRSLRLRSRSSAPRTPQNVSWEIWNDVTHSRYRQRVEDGNGRRFIAEEMDLERLGPSPLQSASVPSVLVELQQILRANQMDARHPLSAAAYETWRRTLSRKTEEVTRNELPDGNAALTLTTTPAGPFTLNAIVKAELIVRTEDWHPVEQRLQAQAKNEIREYELTETRFDVLALNVVPASIFADLEPLRAPLTVAPMVEPVPSPEAPAAPSAEALIASEVEVRYALHRAKACLGEALEVITDRFGVKVQGVVDTALRRDQLLEGLRVIPLTTMEIQTVEEALSTHSVAFTVGSRDEGPQAAVDYTVPPSNSTFPLRESLQKYFAERAASGSQDLQARSFSTQIVEFSNEAVSASQLALAEAWALRHLAEWAEVHRSSALKPQLKWLLEVMAQDHAGALKATMSQCRNLLEPFLSSIVGHLPRVEDKEADASPGPMKDSTWEARCLVLFSRVEEFDRLVRGMFADTGAAGYGEGSVRKLLAALSQTDEQVAQLEAMITEAFSTRPDELSLKSKQE